MTDVLVVGGEFRFDPDQRDAFIASRLDSMRASRAEPGCLEYTFAADPLDAGRVILYERWESQDALDAHLAVSRPAPVADGPAIVPTSMSIEVHDVSGSRPLR